MRRPTLADPSINAIGPHATNREALIHHLKERLSTNSLRNLARADCFFVLGDLFQLAASNWMVINGTSTEKSQQSNISSREKSLIFEISKDI
jgi:hypothetical protein